MYTEQYADVCVILSIISWTVICMFVPLFCALVIPEVMKYLKSK